MKNLYIILLVSDAATEKEINISYRSLAMEYHPDRAVSYLKTLHEEKFKEITFAYSILGDKIKRERYDKYGVTDDTVIVIEEQEDLLKKFNENFNNDESLHEIKNDNFCKALNRDGNEEICNECEGAGIAFYEEGFFINEQACKSCKGIGYIKIKEKGAGFINSLVDDYLLVKDYNNNKRG